MTSLVLVSIATFWAFRGFQGRQLESFLGVSALWEVEGFVDLFPGVLANLLSLLLHFCHSPWSSLGGQTNTTVGVTKTHPTCRAYTADGLSGIL